MNNLITAIQTEDSVTENGMVTNSSSLDPCLNLFFAIGAMRYSVVHDENKGGEEKLIRLFEDSYNKNSSLTRKMLFWVRDVRGGAGERKIFKILLKHLAQTRPEDVLANIELIAKFGRWDDIFVLFGTNIEKNAIELIVDELNAGNALLAKWMPRLGGKVSKADKLIANKVRIAMKLTAKEFRKLLVNLTKVVETPMCAKEYSKIEYGKVPSLAMSRYSKSFLKNDEKRFEQYKESLSKGNDKINAGAIFPYDVIKTIKNGDAELASLQWNALPNYMEGCKERLLPLCDVSGSMDTKIGGGKTTALDVSISLGIYISERNLGPFKDAFITFSSKPKLQLLSGSLQSRCKQLEKSDWEMNTNLISTFNLILDQATKHKVPELEMPTCILIMSDMEFDNCSTYPDDTAMNVIRKRYEESGYKIPKIVFWNLNCRNSNYPVQVNDSGVALVSGFSPSILKAILVGGEEMNPVSIMMGVLDSERYRSVC